MKIFGLQFDIAWEDPPKNYQKVSDHFQKHRPAPGTLCVLPEMFSTGFSMNTAATRESSSAATEKFLGSLAAQYQVGIIAGQVSGPPGAKPMNEAIFIGPTGKLEARYAKQRPFGPAGESDHYTPGHQPVVVNWQGFRLGLFVCYDLRFPELFREALRQGAEGMIVIANWPSARVEHWTTLLRARAIENQAFVVGINRVGKDPHVPYPGRSQVISPLGEIIADAGDSEGVIQADLSRDSVVEWRHRFPAVADFLKSESTSR